MSDTAPAGATPAPEFRVQIDRTPSTKATPKFATARRVNEEAAQEIRQRRADLHRRHREEVAARDAEALVQRQEEAATPPPARENIDSIEFTAPNGMTIVYGPPNAISITDRVARLFAGREIAMHEFRLTRILMGVRSVNGVPEPPINNDIARTVLANKLGDQVIDLLMYYDRIHFPPLQASEIPVVKKTFR